MELWRFLIGLALLSLASVASMVATKQFDLSMAVIAGDYEFIAANIGRAVGRVFAGVMFIGIFIWVPLRWFHGAEKVPDVRRLTLYGAAIMVLLFPVVRFIVGTPLSKFELVGISAFEDTCFTTQRSAKENLALNNSELREWCSCVATSLVKQVTPEEAKYMVENRSQPRSFQEKFIQAGSQCGQKLFPEGLDGRPSMLLL